MAFRATSRAAVSIEQADALFHRPGAPDYPVGPPISSEQALAFAIIDRAVADAFYSSDYALRNSENKLNTADFEPEVIRGEARRFLISDLEPWATDRGIICDMAGVEPRLIRDMARERLEEDREAERAALEAGTEHRRPRRYPGRYHEANPNIIFLEREADLERLVELERIDREAEEAYRAGAPARKAETTRLYALKMAREKLAKLEAETEAA